MTPQFVDFNFDGVQDMVIGVFEGTAFWVPGATKGFESHRHIKDSQDRPVQLSAFWNYEEKKWDSADRSPAGKKNPSHHCTSVVAVDWDGDRDLDLLLGGHYAGAVYLQLNEGSPKEPSYTGVNHPVKAGSGALVIPGGMASMRKVDFNGDGLFDLVCGGKTGGVYLYTNQGKPNAPELSAAQILVKPVENQSAESPRGPQTGFHIDVVDYDGDNDLDLLVGGYSTWKPEQKELNEEQQAKVAELEKSVAAARTQITAAYKDIQTKFDKPEEARAAMGKLQESKEFQELMKRYSTATAQLRSLRPSGTQRKALVWLYRQKT